jgi:CBS domain containing-hemolysin-like protein
MTSILLVAGITLLASFLCSLFEAALYSITPAQVEVLKARKVPQAERLGRMRAGVEEPIAAILTINTIAHTVGASVCGALVAARFGSTAVGTFAAVFTVLVLALTEIVPKSIGVRYAEALGPRITLPLQVMIWSVWPLVWVAKRATRRLMSPVGILGPSEDEVLALSRLAARSGTVRTEEHRWVKNALRLDFVTAGELRTPRTVVETVPADALVSDLLRRPGRWSHSRTPVTEGPDKDVVIGCVHRRDAFEATLEETDSATTVRDIMRPLRFIPSSMAAHRLLDEFLERREHMVGVLDQYGQFQGVVTLEDVLECLLGVEIVDEHDLADDMQEVARRRRPPGAEEPDA